MNAWHHFGSAGLVVAALATGCQARESTSPSPTASLEPYASASPSPTATAWAAVVLPATETGPSPTPFVHIVQKGDTLLAIALKYGVQLDQLLAANPDIDPHFLTVGQALNIPGPNGQPIQSLLPTSTPWALDVIDGRCFATPSGRTVCLATVAAPADTAVEAVSVQFSLVDASGSLITSQIAYAPLNLVPAGGIMPFMAEFESGLGTAAGLQTVLRSAVPVADPTGRYLPASVEGASLVYSDDHRLVHVSGTVHVTLQDSQGGPWRQSLLAMALDSQGSVIGFSKVQFDGEQSQPGDQPFSMDVFSLGPAITDVEIRAEARRIVQTTPTPAP